jgi:hypothetical protein
MGSTHHIDIGREYSTLLGPRLIVDGDYSGEDFRKKHLEPAYLEYDNVVVHLDSIGGYSPSFFEEAFGGLVRIHGPNVLSKIQFEADERKYLIPIIEEWMKEAAKRFQPRP